MKDIYNVSIEERCVILARYLVENKATIRAVAARFGISKSTVHKDISQILKKINMNLYNESKAVLEKNKQERHIRGGEATKCKYRTEGNKAKKA